MTPQNSLQNSRARAPLSTITRVRAGFDRVVMHPPRASPPLAALPSDVLPHYRRVADQRLSRAAQRPRVAYRRRAEYRPLHDRSGPIIDLLYQPRAPFVPPFRLQFRAPSISDLLDLVVVEALCTGVSAALRVPVDRMRVATVELTIDFPGGATAATALQRQLYAPRTRQTRSRSGDDWWSWGRRTSALWFRLYAKRENGVHVARFECVVNRSRLRTLGVNAPADLRAVDWRALVTRSVRFVELVPPRIRRKRVLAKMLASSARVEGIQTTLRKRSRATREWMRRRLRPTATQRAAEQALDEMQRALRAAPISRTPSRRPKPTRLVLHDVPESQSTNGRRDDARLLS